MLRIGTDALPRHAIFDLSDRDGDGVWVTHTFGLAFDELAQRLNMTLSRDG